jgi:hypothetical protein
MILLNTRMELSPKLPYTTVGDEWITTHFSQSHPSVAASQNLTLKNTQRPYVTTRAKGPLQIQYGMISFIPSSFPLTPSHNLPTLDVF